uniref:Uncharacterized protein n=1 Tax=Peronospora matthiolae TaxID=2874970 RepID=A0AAV1U5G8_9STRA
MRQVVPQPGQGQQQEFEVQKTGLQLQEKLRRALKQVAGLQGRPGKAVSRAQADVSSARGRGCRTGSRNTRLHDFSGSYGLAGVRGYFIHTYEGGIFYPHAHFRDSSADAEHFRIESQAIWRFPTIVNLPSLKEVTRSAASKAKPSPVCAPKVARSAASKAKPSPFRDPKVARSATARAKTSPVCDFKPSSAPKETRDAKGRRDLKNRHDPAKPAATPKLGKQKLRGPSSTSSEEEDTSVGENETLAALSGSRPSSRRRASNPAAQPPAGPSPDPIVIDTPSPSRNPPPPVGPFIPTVTKVSRADLFGEASSDSDGAISLFNSPRDHVNPMLSLTDYDSLPPIKVSRNQWIPGYRDRVPRSYTQVSPWSARKVSWTSVAEIDIDFLYRHLSRPKGYIFPTVMAPKCPPPTSEWTPLLACSAQIAALYAQEPWETATRRIAPISFPRTGWFDQLASLYLESEDRNRQALWESTHAIFLSSELRVSDPEPDQFWKQRKQRRS